jgi:hypothetical protein
MNEHEVSHQKKRIENYDRLCERRSEIREALDLVTGHRRIAPDTNPKDVNFPFTGNTRETRRVLTLNIDFSSTLGGSTPMSLRLDDLNIPAGELGRFLEARLKAQIDAINQEIEKL